MTGKMLLALQYWAGDREQAMSVARLIADLEPRFCEKADFLFVARFDCPHDARTVEHVSRKFNVHTYINRRRGQMWPHGCNDLWFGTMDWAYSFGEAKRIPDYKAILTFEADSSPLTPHWITALSDFWDQAQAKVVGALQKYPGEHINGNAMFSGDRAFLKWVAREVGGCAPSGGWDYLLASKFKKWGWSDCPMIRSWWQIPSVAPSVFQTLVNQGVVFFHGCKDDSVIRQVRQRFVG